MTMLDDLRQVMRRDQQWPFLIKRRPPDIDVSHEMILYIEDLSVSFDGFKALNDLNLYIGDGELRCLIGANGAGKTTLMDVITGKTSPDTGSLFFGQTIDLLDHSEAEISELGIGRKFQKPTVFELQTVFANLELAMKANKLILPTLFHRLDSESLDRIDAVLKIVGLRDQRLMLAGALSHGQKQWLEIGMLLISDPRLLLVDEPVAGMTAHETERTAELLTSLAGERTVVVVEHDMEFIRSIARTVTVLHQGTVLAEGSMHDVQNDQRVIEVYLGEGS
jgi:urea transport system ATP-binding protein